jgi:hypothetical protein
MNANQTAHKEMTAHIRTRIKANGIKASVSKYTSCGVNFIRVSVPAFDAEFTQDEQRKIHTVCKSNGMTLSRGMEIIIDQLTSSKEFTCVML